MEPKTIIEVCKEKYHLVKRNPNSYIYVKEKFVNKGSKVTKNEFIVKDPLKSQENIKFDDKNDAECIDNLVKNALKFANINNKDEYTNCSIKVIWSKQKNIKNKRRKCTKCHDKDPNSKIIECKQDKNEKRNSFIHSSLTYSPSMVISTITENCDCSQVAYKPPYSRNKVNTSIETCANDLLTALKNELCSKPDDFDLKMYFMDEKQRFELVNLVFDRVKEQIEKVLCKGDTVSSESFKNLIEQFQNSTTSLGSKLDKLITLLERNGNDSSSPKLETIFCNETSKTVSNESTIMFKRKYNSTANHISNAKRSQSPLHELLREQDDTETMEAKSVTSDEFNDKTNETILQPKEPTQIVWKRPN